MERAAVTGLAGLCGQVESGDLLGGDADAPEIDVDLAADMLAKLVADVDVDQDACGVVITDVEDDRGASSGEHLDLLGRLECEGHAREAAGGIERQDRKSTRLNSSN